jgi:N-acetylneuraminic acid mutarotase
MNNHQQLTKIIITLSAVFVLMLQGCGQVNSPDLVTTGGPAFPTGVSASPGNGQVALSWNAVPDATSYNIYWSTSQGTGANGTKISNITLHSYTHTSVTNGVIYYYVVTAIIGAAESVPSDQVSAMPLATLGSWTTKASLSKARYALTSSAVSGNIYAMGGVDINNFVSNVVEQYTPGSLAWTTKTAMLTARSGLASSATSTMIYAIGGWNGTAVVNTVEAYNPSLNTWSTVAPMLTARSELSSSATNTLIYAIGGWNGFAAVNTIEAYNPSLNTWTTVAPMPTARQYAASCTAANEVYVIGGTVSNVSGTTIALQTVEAYNPSSNTWTTMTPMPTARWGMSCSVANGLIYVMGGWNDSVGFMNTVEVYNPITNTWASEEPMLTARYQLTSSAVNGIIYAIGGWTGSQVSGFGPANTVEALTP